MDANVTEASQFLVFKSRSVPIIATIGTAVVASSLWLAVENLLHRTAVAPSALWLFLIAFVVISNIRNSGLRAFVAACAGAFSRQQVLIVNASDDCSILQVGFRLFGFNIVEHRLLAEDLVSIRCSRGQASDLAGRDVNDWSVILWYRHHDRKIQAIQQQFGAPRPGQSPLVIGPPRKKTLTEPLARRVICFLNESGISVTAEE